MHDMPIGPARRVRHDLKFRRLTVRAVTQLTPGMVRTHLAGDLSGFVSLGFDDHLKVLLPMPGQDEVSAPVFSDTGASFPDGQRPYARDYTPRAWNVEAGTLDLDFALHETGPATSWARSAKAGDTLAIAGPRGSLIVPADYDHHVLIGDETALPAIGRRLEELPSGVRATAIVEIANAAEEQPLQTSARLELTWAHRGDAEAGASPVLIEAARRVKLTGGDVYVWTACESLNARAVRKVLIEERGLDKSQIRAAGYWRRGAQGVHEPQHG
ncbi:MAG: siderophore-interacting protein [Reyranellaceae bacterium]